MAFIQEPTHYHKTVLSDLQGSWSLLRETVVNNFNFENADKLLFHIDEAMSWEFVRNLARMRATFILVRNIALQSQAPQVILDAIDEVQHDLDETMQALAQGELS
ncbi:hypothetical protein [Methylotuvimicrobium sp.]|uniref:hypothetical protein n=1 Tax=Methylotuvimicrobium sp. TaxID=2822413 RepID=UPI003D65F675